MRIPLLGCLALVAGIGLAVPASAQSANNAVASADTAIPAMPLKDALNRFAERTGLQLVYVSSLVDGLETGGAPADLTAEGTLQHLLQGTGLAHRFINARTVTIGKPEALLDGSGLANDPSLTPGVDAGTSQPAGAQSSVASVIDAARQGGIEEIIVTGQKREERIQDVPIAISAFSMENLDNQKIEGGFDLLKAVPNVTFSKSNFTGYNFQIRGIGTQAISATTDPGVAVSFNNTTLIVNRLFEQEYLDIERVEVLRGPQGTLFGRNATGGVINLITAKPEMGVWGGEIKVEGGNYNAKRVRGHINVPLFDSDVLAARIAYASTERDGYGTNLAEGEQFLGRDAPSSVELDNRNLRTGRLSVGWRPNDRFRADVIFEKFEEDDHRLRSAKQLCHRDPGLTEVDGFSLSDLPGSSAQQKRERANLVQVQMTQGCLPGSLYDKGNPDDPESNGAYGVPQGNAIPFVRSARGSAFRLSGLPVTGGEFAGLSESALRRVGLCSEPTFSLSWQPLSGCVADVLSAGSQSHDLRTIYSPITPEYQAESDYYELSASYELTDQINIFSQTVYMENDLFSTQDFLRFETVPNAFMDSRAACTGSPNQSAACLNLPWNFSQRTITASNNGQFNPFHRNISPGGIMCDPQLGCSDRFLMQDVSQQRARQLSQEFRLASNFDGNLNFSLGVNYTRFENRADYFVFSNLLTALAQTGQIFYVDRNYNVNSGSCGPDTYTDELGRASCLYVQKDGLKDTAANPEGHNFFLSRNPFVLKSAGIFGELYYNATDTLKLTAGLRMNWDRKTFTPTPSQTLLMSWDGVSRFLGNADFGAGSPMSACVDKLENRSFLALTGSIACSLSGHTTYGGRGYPTLPDIVQEWRVPTGRLGFDWKPDLDVSWIDESLLYIFYTRGYKAGGANPPMQAPPSGLTLAKSQGVAAPPVFKAEYVNAVEVGAKNSLLARLLTLNMSAFHYSYKDYQISKIVDRSAVNENFDATVWGVELETILAPSVNTLFNASVGYLRTRVADGEQSLDLMDRTQGGNQHYVNPAWANLTEAQLDCNNPNPNSRHLACDYPNGFDKWIVVKPTITQASNCVVPEALMADLLAAQTGGILFDLTSMFCPAGPLVSTPTGVAAKFNPRTDAPNAGAGFLADVSGNELPNAPRFTVSLGAQHTVWMPGDEWNVTGRIDWYWQDKSFHRVYNTEYDRLQDWTSTNISLWMDHDRYGLRLEVYVKNLLNESPITGAFLNSDDTGLSTNVFTLDPRLVGLSIRKQFR